MTQSKDHEELLAFLLGQLVKDKARFHQLRRYEQPELVTVKIPELEERVRVLFRDVSTGELIPLSGKGTRYIRYLRLPAVEVVHR